MLVSQAPVTANGQPARRLKVLALHSFRTSANIFRQQFLRAKLVENLGDLVEMVGPELSNRHW
jgi:hypothetical protein